MPKPAQETAPLPQAVPELQQILVNLIGLSLQAKQAHWNVTGPLFQPLHETFDAFTDAYRGWYDSVAERIRALGAPADGRLATVAGAAGMAELPAGPLPDRKVVGMFLAALQAVASDTRGRLSRLGEQDVVTQDLVIGIVEGLEKQAWMLKAQAS